MGWLIPGILNGLEMEKHMDIEQRWNGESNNHERCIVRMNC